VSTQQTPHSILWMVCVSTQRTPHSILWMVCVSTQQTPHSILWMVCVSTQQTPHSILWMVCVSTQRTPHNILWAFALLCRSACAYIRIHNTHARSVSNRRKCPTSRRAPCWGSIDRDATHSQHMFPMGSFRLKNSIFENESIMIKIEQAYRGELSVSKIVSNL
jgi:hypothetical protein